MGSNRVCYTVAGGVLSAPRAGASTVHPPARSRLHPLCRPLSSSLALSLSPPSNLGIPSTNSRSQPAPSLHPLSQSGPGNPPAPAATGGTAVVWFRADLRLHDHPALVHALEDHANIVPVFIFDPRCFATTHFGFKKTGTYRTRFLLESVSALRSGLRALGSELLIRMGHPEDVLPTLCARAGARSLLFHSEVSGEDRAVERAVIDAARKAGVEASALWTGTLYGADDVPFALADTPTVYTEFREVVQRSATRRDPLPPPDRVPPPPHRAGAAGRIPSMRDLGLQEPHPAPAEERSEMRNYVGGEPAALQRLARYAAEHAQTSRGRSAAAHFGTDFTSRISPYLATGCLSPRRLYAELLSKAAKATLTATYFELVWRDYFRFITATSELAGDEVRRRRSPTTALGQV